MTIIKIIKLIIFSTVAIIVTLIAISRHYHRLPFYQNINYATAVIHPTQGNNTQGLVIFTQDAAGLHIEAQLTNLTPGDHAFHIHEFGDCACDDAVCAGGHFNPTNKMHGGPESNNRHVGDLGNITANEHGNGSYSHLDKEATLNGPHSIIGRSVIIHAQADDFTSQPTGNAGARVGCGVIGIAKKPQS